jgi:hypothetical protein
LVVQRVQANPLIRAALAGAIAAGVLACDIETSLPPNPAAIRATEETQLADRLRRHLEAISGVSGATVVARLPVADPFARTPVAQPAWIAAAVSTRTGVNPEEIRSATTSAAHVLAGTNAHVAVDIAVLAAVPRATSVGPFEVAPRSRTPLLLTLGLGLGVIAALATALAWALGQRGIKPQ